MEKYSSGDKDGMRSIHLVVNGNDGMLSIHKAARIG